MFGILVSISRVLHNTMEERPKIVRHIVLTCVVLHNILRTHRGGRAQQPNPQDDLAAINEYLLRGAGENWRNPSRLATKRLPKVYFNHKGAFCGQDEKMRWYNMKRSYREDRRNWYLLVLFRTTLL